jgi:hypothetical protein
VQGAARIFGLLFADDKFESFALPSLLRIQTNLAGDEFADVGPSFSSSYS